MKTKKWSYDGLQYVSFYFHYSDPTPTTSGNISKATEAEKPRVEALREDKIVAEAKIKLKVAEESPKVDGEKSTKKSKAEEKARLSIFILNVSFSTIFFLSCSCRFLDPKYLIKLAVFFKKSKKEFCLKH